MSDARCPLLARWIPLAHWGRCSLIGIRCCLFRCNGAARASTCIVAVRRLTTMPRFTSQAAGDAIGRRWDEPDASQPRWDASQPRLSGRFSPPSNSAGSQAQARLQSQDFSVSSPSVRTPERSTGSVLGHSAGPQASVLGRRYSGHYQDNGFVSRS